MAMSRFDGGANEFDMYFIPVTPEDKAIKESMKTAHTLSKAGVDNKRLSLFQTALIRVMMLKMFSARFSTS